MSYRWTQVASTVRTFRGIIAAKHGTATNILACGMDPSNDDQ